jgi:hypothetical protein
MPPTSSRQSAGEGSALAATILVLLLMGSAPAGTPSLREALSTVDSLRSHGHFPVALGRLDSLAQVHADTAAVHWRRALLLADLGKRADDTDRKRSFFLRSLRASRQARALDSTSAWAHLTTALAQGRLTLHVGTAERVRRSREVKLHADRALALDSSLAAAYHLRGRWHRQVADLNLLERALVKGLYGGLPTASFERSVWNFKQAIARESKPYNHLELAKTYLAMDRPGAAVSQLRTSLRTSGSPFDAEYKEEARVLLSDLTD